MDAKTLTRWRRMAMASTAGLVAEESCRRIEIHDGDGVMAMTDGASKQDHDNANFWAEARGMVLALLGEVEKTDDATDEECGGVGCGECGWCATDEKERREMRESERAAVLDDKEKEIREER